MSSVTTLTPEQIERLKIYSKKQNLKIKKQEEKIEELQKALNEVDSGSIFSENLRLKGMLKEVASRYKALQESTNNCSESVVDSEKNIELSVFYDLSFFPHETHFCIIVKKKLIQQILKLNLEKNSALVSKR